MPGSFPIAVLVSGAGTNLQAILDTVRGRDGIEVAGVASSEASAAALERARAAGVETAVFEQGDYPDRAARDAALADWLAARGVRLVVLAGFMELLDPAFLARFPQAVINVHPALLPAFPGIQAVLRQAEHGVKVSGVTVHFVDEGVDTGPIIAQEALVVEEGWDAFELRERLQEIEHRILPRAVRLFAAGALRVDPDNPRIVHVDQRALAA